MAIAAAVVAIKVAILLLLLAGLIFRTKETVGLVAGLGILALIRSYTVACIFVGVVLVVVSIYRTADAEALSVLLKAWHMEFGKNAAMLRTVFERAASDPDGDLWLAMQELPFMGAKEVDRNRFGHYLKKNVNRFADGLKLVKGDCTERNAWAVVPAGTKPSGFQRDAKPSGSPWKRPSKATTTEIDIDDVF